MSESLCRHTRPEADLWKFLIVGPACLGGLILCLALIQMGLVSPPVAFAFLMAGLILLGFAKPQYIFLAAVLSLPFEVLYAPEAPLNVQMALLVAMAGLVVGFILSPSLSHTPVDHLFLVYLGVLVISILQTYVFSGLELPRLLPEELGWRASPYRGWYQLAAIGMGMATVHFTVRNITSSGRLRTAVLSLLSISFAVALFSLYEEAAKLAHLPLVYFSFHDFDYVSQSRYVIAGMAIPRVYGSAGEPLSFGNFLLLPLSLSAACLLRGKGLPRHRPMLYATLATVTLAILLTFSTSAWFGAMLSLSSLLLVLSRSRRFLRIVVFLAVIAMTSLFFSPIDTPQTVQSISDIQRQKIQASLGGDTRDFRYLGWQRSFGIITRFPVLGVGLGNEPFWMDSSDLTIGSYNILLSHFVEMGALGFGVFLYLMIKLVRLFHAAYRRARNREQSAISLGCAAALLGCLGSHMAWGGRLTAWEWFLIGLGLATHKIIQIELRAVHQNRSRAEGSPNGQSSRPEIAILAVQRRTNALKAIRSLHRGNQHVQTPST